MKGAGKTILSVAFVSALMLLYVHEQVALFRISYQLDAKSEKLARLSEDYRKVKFEVDQLRAPRLLEQKMKDMQIELALPKEVQVVKIPAAAPLTPESLPNVSLKPLSDGLLDFLGRWVKIAQAKTDN